MKKIIKLLSLSLVMFMLVACTNNGNQEETTAESTTAEETTTVETTPEASQNVSGNESNQEENQGDESPETASENAAKFTFYVHGEEQPELTFTIENAVGKSVREAMESQDKVPVIFSEDEGVFTSINNIENNYAANETWAYLYNGHYAELGVVSQKLEPGDEISWYFGTVDEIPMNLIPAE